MLFTMEWLDDDATIRDIRKSIVIPHIEYRKVLNEISLCLRRSGSFPFIMIASGSCCNID